MSYNVHILDMYGLIRASTDFRSQSNNQRCCEFRDKFLVHQTLLHRIRQVWNLQTMSRPLL